MGKESLPSAGRFVDNALVDLFTETIEQLIADMGRKVIIYLPPSASGCPNCFIGFDGTSNGVYDSNNPFALGGPLNIPFPNGGVCPVCFKEDALISTFEGHKKIKDIIIGSKVLDAFGKEQIVTNKFYRFYNGKFVKLTIDDFNDFICTSNHPIFIKQGDKFVERRAAELKQNDEVIYRHHRLINRTFKQNYELRKVKKIDIFNDSCFVYNLEVANSHSYIANGISVGNCHATHKIKTPRSAQYTALIQRQPKDLDYNQLGKDISSRNIFRTKTVLTSNDDVVNARKILIDDNMCVSIRDPVKTGLRDLKFIQAWWMKTNK